GRTPNQLVQTTRQIVTCARATDSNRINHLLLSSAISKATKGFLTLQPSIPAVATKRRSPTVLSCLVSAVALNASFSCRRIVRWCLEGCVDVRLCDARWFA
ncbi:hypothetical protein U1Q18_031784, partial [Sarracenia purpurea var. burkii]